jgi:hypothetical protein
VPAPCLPVLLALVASAPDTGAAPPTAVDAGPAPAEALPVPAPADVSTAPAQPADAPAPSDAAPPGPDAAVVVAPANDMSFGTAPGPAPSAARKPPPEHGPFFAGEPASDTAFPNGPRPADPPRFSLGRGAFCFLDDSHCKSALVLTADVGIGVNIVSAVTRLDVPYAQYNFRGGLVFKPMLQRRPGGWHPWGVGVVGSWSRGTAAPAASKRALTSETTHTPAFRVFLVNQLWLSQKRNGFHLDVDLGIVRSQRARQHEPASCPRTAATPACRPTGAAWGGHVPGRRPARPATAAIVFGFRGNGAAAAPIIGLVLLGLLAGGAL